VSTGTEATVDPLRLRSWGACGGCAAKWGAGPLGELVETLAAGSTGLLVGLAPFDDAAVLVLDDHTALVSTTDFFPPMVDDPADFGAIAAANACSDVWAMGGEVRLALNIAGFPEGFPEEGVKTILLAAARVVADAGGVIGGGHTIRAPQPIFGLAVQGLVDPARVWTKGGAIPGQLVMLSKPIGTGIGLSGSDAVDEAVIIDRMKVTNRAAARALRDVEDDGLIVGAVTDVTGFGLLGHAWEVAERSGVRLELTAGAVPLYPGVRALADEGVRTGADERNRASLAGKVEVGADPGTEALLYDPQTSGGLLATVAPGAQSRLLAAGFAVIGAVVAGSASVVVRP
jgi:selenide, water dikinase